MSPARFGRRDPVLDGLTASPLLLRGRRTARTRPEGIDWTVLLITLILLSFGSLMVFSATISLADDPRYGVSNLYFITHHLCSVAVALLVGCLVYRVPMWLWERASWVILTLSVILLVAVLVPGIGTQSNGARRWIMLGPISFQVTELVKVAVLVGAASYTVRRQDFMHSYSKGFLPMVLFMSIIAFLISYQPDLGATLVIVAIALGVLFLGGLKLSIVGTALAAAAVGVGIAVWTSPWRVGRFLAYLHPWDPRYNLDKAYQLSHSLIAFGRGELFGVGIGGSVEKLHYLPEAHTDFILAVIGEEAGFVGVLLVIVCFYWLVRRAFAIGRQAIKLERIFAGLLAQGVGIWIGAQVVINAGVATGLLPTKGLTLPLMSYGGSSLLATIVAIAMLLRVDAENRILMSGGRV